ALSPWPYAMESDTSAALLVYNVDATAEGNRVTGHSQHWAEAFPHTQSIFNIATGATETPSIVISADGSRAAAVVTEEGVTRLVEFALDGSGEETVLASAHQIVPGSVSYDASGDRVAFVRQDSPGKQALWIATSGGKEQDAKPLALGERIESAYAFNAE